MTYVHIIKLNKERNIYLSITTPPPHTILHMHIRNYNDKSQRKFDYERRQEYFVGLSSY